MTIRAWVVVASVGLGSSPALAQEAKKPEAPALKEAQPEPAAALDKGYAYLQLERKGAASDVIRTARKVEDEAKCDSCGGDGEKVVEYYEQVKRDPRVNIPLREKVKKTRTEKCVKCTASGLSSDKMFLVAMDNFTKAICGLKDGDPKSEEAMTKAAGHLQAALSGGGGAGKCAAAGQAFGAATRSRTSDQPLKTGTPIYVVGYLMDDQTAVGDSRPLRVSTIAPGGRVPMEEVIWVSEPVLSRAAKGERVIVGGLFAGRQTVGENKSVPVAQGGWVVGVR